MQKQPAYEQRITGEQKEVLLEFMDSHPEFSKSKLLGMEGRKQKNALWAVLTEQLNSCEGPTKTTEKWQRVWADLKTKIKRKAAEINSSRRKTGGGPASTQVLTAFESKMLDFLTEEAVHGLQGPDGVQLDTKERPTGNLATVTFLSSSPQSEPAVHENDFPSTPTGYSSCATPTGYSSSEDVEIREISTPALRSIKRKRCDSKEDAVERFAKMSEALNAKVDRVVEVLTDLVAEKKQTNSILKTLIELMAEERQS